MKKTFVFLNTLSLFIFILAGCSNFTSTKSNDDLENSYTSEDEAFKSAKEDRKDIQEIIGETKYVDDEKIVIYTIKDRSNLGIGTATLTQVDNKVKWDFNSNPSIIKQPEGNTDIVNEIKTPSGKKYELYAGTPEKPNMTIETKIDTEAKPHINKKYNIYYLLEPIPNS